MQAELIYRKSTALATSSHQELTMAQAAAAAAAATAARVKRESRNSRETIHSGHFMVSDFEAEAQDDEDELAVPVPEEEAARLAIIAVPGFSLERFVMSPADKSSQQLSIETSLNKLFQCMSLAYRQKLTSPKWNRFKGIRLRWKDKIRLNNVIWRCWHMQFILRQNTLVCQFASPLDVDTHNKPEAIVLEGKYWKRKLAAVTAEYKKWRMFYRNRILGWTNKDGSDMLEAMDTLEWGGGMGNSGMFDIGAGSSYSGGVGPTGGEAAHSMMVDEDYMDLMSDTLFSTISSNQPLYFPDPREIARGASLADFIQPSLGPLQPNLDDFIDTLEPLQEFLSSRLPPVPEEDVFQNSTISSTYSELDLITPISQVNSMAEAASVITVAPAPAGQSMQTEESASGLQNLQYTAKIYAQAPSDPVSVFRNNSGVGQTYGSIQSSYEQQMQQATQSSREKQPRQSRALLRASRLAQQQQQQQQQQRQPQQQQNYQSAAAAVQQQHLTYSNSQRDYGMRLTNSALAAPSEQMQLALTDQNSAHVQALMVQQQQQSNFVQAEGQPQAQSQTQQQAQQVQKPIKPGLSCKPYSKISNQGYKFSPPAPSFDTQQCKFTSNNAKALPAQPMVAVTTQQSVQPHVYLQCKPGIDLTAPTLHPTKSLPRSPAPASASVDNKEEVFAVPKYQMKGRNRSRSSSSLVAPRMHPPPLVSAVSDPALNLNNNVLLAHLLTNNSPNLYTVSSTSDKVPSQPVLGVKHVLPMLPSTLASGTPQVTKSSHHMTSAGTVQAINSVQSQAQQQSSVPNQQILLNTSAQAGHQSQSSNPNSPKENSSVHSPPGLSISPLHSPMSIGSPLSPTRIYVKGEPERGGQYKEQRRVGHIHAEQKRRYNIKNGFDMLYSLIPQLSQNPNTKMSKAAMLQKGADYIRLLRSERHQLKDEMDKLRSQIETLNAAINNCQSLLPATGAPVSRQRTNKMKEMFDEYVRTRTRDNWKFWIFSILLEPLMVSFNTSVSTASIEDLYRTTILWVEQHCSLVDLRPAVLNSLRYLCTATDILNDPSRLPEEALAAVNDNERRKSMQ